MKTFICHAENLKLGGVLTYFTRMLTWASNNGYNSYMISNSLDDADWDYLNTLNSIIIINYKNYDKNNIFIKSLEESEEIVAIAENYDNYIRIYYDLRKFTYKLKIYLYFLHPKATIYSNKHIVNEIFIRSNIGKDLYSNHVLCMDKTVHDQLLKQFSRDSVKSLHDTILPIGMHIPSYNKGKVIDKASSSTIRQIITVTRMEIPFKGYIFGLIDDFVELQNEYNNIKLVIVGSGPNEGDIIDKIKRIGSKNIIWRGKIEYNELSNELDNAYISIGMGTTVLDSIKLGIPTICATAYQNKNYSSGILFYNKHAQIGLVKGENHSEDYTFKDLLKILLNMSPEEYVRTSYRVYENCKMAYDIGIIMNNIVNCGKYAHSFNGYFWKIYVEMRRFARRLRKS